jgi:indoleamine 2,3-dioxygenase
MLLQVPADNRRRGFLPTEDVHYEGVAQEQLSYRGETRAQSSILPLLTGLMKNRHRENALTHHLAALRDYMPAEHRALIGFVGRLPDLRDLAAPACFNWMLDAMAEFREIHFGWAEPYIHRYTDDPRAPVARRTYHGCVR